MTDMMKPIGSLVSDACGHCVVMFQNAVKLKGLCWAASDASLAGPSLVHVLLQWITGVLLVIRNPVVQRQAGRR